MNTNGTANEAHARHLENLKRMSTREQRAEYIDGVKRAEGNFYGKWLAEDFAKWWASGRKHGEMP